MFLLQYAVSCEKGQGQHTGLFAETTLKTWQLKVQIDYLLEEFEIICMLGRPCRNDYVEKERCEVDFTIFWTHMGGPKQYPH